MTIQPNTEMKYKDGNRNYTVKFLNVVNDDTEDNGYIGFTVYWRQSSKSGYAGGGLVHPTNHDCRVHKFDGDMSDYIRKAIAFNNW